MLFTFLLTKTSTKVYMSPPKIGISAPKYQIYLSSTGIASGNLIVQPDTKITSTRTQWPEPVLSLYPECLRASPVSTNVAVITKPHDTSCYEWFKQPDFRLPWHLKWAANFWWYGFWNSRYKLNGNKIEATNHPWTSIYVNTWYQRTYLIGMKIVLHVKILILGGCHKLR